jgi:hypothetical protein
VATQSDRAIPDARSYLSETLVWDGRINRLIKKRRTRIIFPSFLFCLGSETVLYPLNFSSLLMFAAMLAPVASFGQAIPPSKSSQLAASGHPTQRVWPAPVRQAQYTEAMEGSIGGADLVALPVNALRDSMPLRPHQIIRAPNRQARSVHRQSGPAQPDLPQWSHHKPIQPSTALLPEANQREIWKTPYSYGYFGASGSRHWTRHYGYRDRYTQWHLR